MGSNSNTSCWYAISIYVLLIFMIFNLSFFPSFSLPINYNISTTHISPNSLDDYLYNYSSRLLGNRARTRTGVIYNISLPANFSGMEVSVLRLRSSPLWAKGANFSSFDIPPKIVTFPFVKRLAIMFENFGNLSSHYYELPGYTLVTAVVGLAMYDATDLTGNTSPKRLNITLIGEPLSVKFPRVLVQVPHERIRNVELEKCVRFDPASGIVELSNMVKSNVCSSRALGHFAIVMPRVIGLNPVGSPAPSSPLSKSPREKKKVWLWKKWVIAFAVALAGLMLVVSVSVLGYKTYNSRKMRRMERSAEKSESLRTRWVGSSKMPSASSTRTQGDIFDETD